jgi:exopolyphosphatase/guanosine-5'-triphosphate,3'-diphosphate pyrophosphatase
VARYHRRGTPKASHEEYARLASGRRRTVRVLSSMLRVAESLDRSHSQVIANLTVRARADEVRVDVQAAGDAELELWATSRQMEPFEAVVGCRVRLTLDSRIRPPAAPAGKTAKAARSSRPAKAARPRATARG